MKKPQKRKRQNRHGVTHGSQSTINEIKPKDSKRFLTEDMVKEINLKLQSQKCPYCSSNGFCELQLLNTNLDNLLVICHYGCNRIFGLPKSLNTLELEVIA